MKVYGLKPSVYITMTRRLRSANLNAEIVLDKHNHVEGLLHQSAQEMLKLIKRFHDNFDSAAVCDTATLFPHLKKDQRSWYADKPWGDYTKKVIKFLDTWLPSNTVIYLNADDTIHDAASLSDLSNLLTRKCCLYRPVAFHELNPKADPPLIVELDYRKTAITETVKKRIKKLRDDGAAVILN